MVINSVVRIFILLLSKSEENLGEIFLLFLFSLIIDFSLRIHWYFHVKFHDSTDNELLSSADVSCWVFSLALIGWFGWEVAWQVIARGQLSVFLIRQLKNKNKMSTLSMQWCGKRHFRVSRNYLVISKISDQTNLNIQIFSPYFSRIQTNEIHFQRSSTNRRHTYQFKK